jgi:hypothetical protein
MLSACESHPFTQPTPTPTATLEIEPIFPKMIMVKPGSFQMGFTYGQPSDHTVIHVNWHEAAWYATDQTHPIGRKMPNEVG